MAAFVHLHHEYSGVLRGHGKWQLPHPVGFGVGINECRIDSMVTRCRTVQLRGISGTLFPSSTGSSSSWRFGGLGRRRGGEDVPLSSQI
uniref:Uncharacterized protein n=1 Tax=Leersia perrieri TaxID=77586 RepID=A0A0D9X7L1_9ORYZ